MSMETPESRFQHLLKWASFHLAADYGNEYLQGYRNISDCAGIALENGWSEDKVREVSAPVEGLATADDVLTQMKLRGK